MFTKEERGRYFSILADGKMHETVPQSTDGAVLREYETSDGQKGSKWELVYTKIEATITNVRIVPGDYGDQLQVTFTDGDNRVILSQNTSSSFGEEVMKKLPNVDFAKKVSMRPFAFHDEKNTEKIIRGIQVFQDKTKINNFFWDAEKKVELNGFPKPEGDTKTYKTDDWKIHFLKTRKFLVEYMQANICSKFKTEDKSIEYPEGPNPDSIPF